MMCLLHAVFGHNFHLLKRVGKVAYYRCSCGLRGVWTEETQSLFYSQDNDSKFHFEELAGE